MAGQPKDLPGWKRAIRARARADRRRQGDKDRLSREICGRLVALPEYLHAATVMSYVDVRSEVGTRGFLAHAWRDGKRVVVPYCRGGRLELCRLEGII